MELSESNKEMLKLLNNLKKPLKKKNTNLNNRKMLAESNLVLKRDDNNAHFVYENEETGVRKEFLIENDPIICKVISMLKEDAFEELDEMQKSMNEFTSMFGGQKSNLKLDSIYISSVDGKMHYSYQDPNFVE